MSTTKSLPAEWSQSTAPKILATRLCVECGAEPERFGGHVHRNGETLIAGWCQACLDSGRMQSRLMDERLRAPTVFHVCVGCLGEWRSQSGEQRIVIPMSQRLGG